MIDEARRDLLHALAGWDRAMVANDASAIERYMAEDWTIVGPDGSLDGKRHFLDLVRSGVLTHDVMESHEVDARLYGDTAVVVARGVSGDAYHGQLFHVVERVSSVFLRQDGQWRCVLTHLSRLGQPA
jgi:ketosteroid isomerase-like protein